MTTTVDTARPTTPSTQLVRRLPIAAAAALALNLIVYLAGSLAGASWLVTTPQVIGVGMVTIGTLVPFVLAGAGVWALSRRWPQGPRWASWAGLAFGVLTLPMSLIAATDPTTGISLASMHVITGVAWLLAVLPPRSRA
ncbi:MAG: DUF6069 family protein [Actinobacteria bacterium]|nr:DUF6069 family protein [Actinomycetota bacterium]